MDNESPSAALWKSMLMAVSKITPYSLCSALQKGDHILSHVKYSSFKVSHDASCHIVHNRRTLIKVCRKNVCSYFSCNELSIYIYWAIIYIEPLYIYICKLWSGMLKCVTVIVWLMMPEIKGLSNVWKWIFHFTSELSVLVFYTGKPYKRGRIRFKSSYDLDLGHKTRNTGYKRCHRSLLTSLEVRVH